MVRGRIRVDHGFSGAKILRFGELRTLHPLADGELLRRAGPVGPHISFGRILILPLFGANAFATMSTYAKYAHDYLAFPFMLGLAIMFLIWIKDNVPARFDLGGSSRRRHPVQRKASAGQAFSWPARRESSGRDNRVVRRPA